MTKALDLTPDLLRFSKHAGFVRVAVQRIFEDMCAWEHVKKRPTENYAENLRKEMGVLRKELSLASVALEAWLTQEGA